MKEQLLNKAIESVLNSEGAFCKFLSANDSGETGGHQVGILVSNTAKDLMFTEKEILENHIAKRNVKIKWQNDFCTDSCFTWYTSKGELRITRFGRGFPLLTPDFTGALFVLARNTKDDYEGFIFNEDEEIQQFLEAFGLTPAETNRPIDLSDKHEELLEQQAIDTVIAQLTVDFPSSVEMSNAARWIYEEVYLKRENIKDNPDKILLQWTEIEYRLFRAIEQSRYGREIKNGFQSVDDFIVLANRVLNRRKSRAGRSLENHLAAIFTGLNIPYTPQGVTEGNKKPDFVFPSIEAYHDLSFDIDGICTLAAKTTCKDRWRQVINEADRLRDKNKYLCTMQQGISSAQMDEMEAEKVILVVPKPYISSYPKEKQNRIWTIKKFVTYVKEIGAQNG